jgi:hypothetical protein
MYLHMWGEWRWARCIPKFSITSGICHFILRYALNRKMGAPSLGVAVKHKLLTSTSKTHIMQPTACAASPYISPTGFCLQITVYCAFGCQTIHDHFMFVCCHTLHNVWPPSTCIVTRFTMSHRPPRALSHASQCLTALHVHCHTLHNVWPPSTCIVTRFTMSWPPSTCIVTRFTMSDRPPRALELEK